MRQQVNLLTATLVPPREWLPLAQLPWLMGGWTLLLAVFGTLSAYQNWSLQQDIAAARTIWQAEQRKTAETQAKYQPVSASVQLVAEVERLEQRRESRKALLNTLQDERLSEAAAGFSSYFAALAERRVEGLWLTQLAVDRSLDTVEIQGRAIDAQQVPTWMASLQIEDAFSGGSFQSLEVGAQGEPNSGHSFEVQGRLQ